MARHDVANLIIRTFALWLGVTGIMTLASVPWLASLPDQPAPILTALILTIPLPAGVALWKMAPRLARAMFDRPDGVVSYALTPDGVPPLASFVVGLVVLAGAVPQAASWLAMQVVRSQAAASLMNPDLLPSLDQRSAGTGAEVVTRLLVGAVLMAISRRRDIWATPAIDDTDTSS